MLKRLGFVWCAILWDVCHFGSSLEAILFWMALVDSQALLLAPSSSEPPGGLQPPGLLLAFGLLLSTLIVGCVCGFLLARGCYLPVSSLSQKELYFRERVARARAGLPLSPVKKWN